HREHHVLAGEPGESPAEVPEPVYAAVCVELERLGTTVARGRFGADMQVASVNDGPVTLTLESP
ncbi:D-aminoacyl-tRNA deacylase, partial [Nocardioides sp.]|uniref:D-aminoacyl-tRNA deacylase n=1 Tax=Nocardioides sp. TaxID=35761 RepID=UPI00286DBDC0